MVYPLFNSTSFNVFDFFSYVTLVDPIFFPIMVFIVIFPVALLSTLRFGFARAFVFASFFAAILNMVLVVVGLMSGWYLTTSLIMLALGVFFLHMSNSPG